MSTAENSKKASNGPTKAKNAGFAQSNGYSK
ncbi:TPA_asm: hypothetical protein [Porphyromonas phage phage030a_KCOM2803]|uniref:Uncharacterized protein n=1 Tax=Porphyromonas phage phage030a_KCOM2803 TaxID=3154120 RepID=A0AAT9J9F5_9CAUD